MAAAFGKVFATCIYSEGGDMLVLGGIGAPRIQSASHGAPGGHGGAGNSGRHSHPPITQTSAEERKAQPDMMAMMPMMMTKLLLSSYIHGYPGIYNIRLTFLIYTELKEHKE